MMDEDLYLFVTSDGHVWIQVSVIGRVRSYDITDNETMQTLHDGSEGVWD